MNLFPTLNPALGITGLLALALSASIALAETRETMKIKVITDDGVRESVTIENLAVGESEVFTTDSGNEVLVSRHDGGLELEVAGRVIEVKLPDVSAHSETLHAKHVFLSEVDSLTDGSTVVIGDGEVQVHQTSADVMVIDAQGGSLSEEDLQALLHEHAEHMNIEIEAGDDHEVIIIKKKFVSIEQQDED